MLAQVSPALPVFGIVREKGEKGYIQCMKLSQATILSASLVCLPALVEAYTEYKAGPALVSQAWSGGGTGRNHRLKCKEQDSIWAC